MTMPYSVKPPMWPLSPALTEAPELWRNHVFTMFGWEGAGGPRRFPFDAPTSFNTGWGTNKYGATVSPISVPEVLITYNNTKSTVSAPFTILIVESHTTTNNSVLFDAAENDLSIQISSGGEHTAGAVIIQLDAGDIPEASTNTARLDGKPHSTVFRVDVNLDITVFVDGVDDTKFERKPNSPISLNNEFDVFSRGGALPFPGDISLIHFIETDLGYSRSKRLSADPFAMLRPRSDF